MKCYSDVEIQPVGGPEDDGPKGETTSSLEDDLPLDNGEEDTGDLLEEENLLQEDDALEESGEDALEQEGA